MALINEHYLKLTKNYLFADIAKKVNAFKVSHQKANVISLGIGDVTRPLCPAVIKAMHKAVDEMSTREGFHGYGPEQGYMFLREAIVKNDYLSRGIHIDPSEVFVNDGAKSDTGNIGELVRWDNNFGVTDPVYPVYVDSNVMCGRAGALVDGKWSNVTYIPCTEENNFVPQIPDQRVDIIYLCYPNNPTGTVITKEELRKWVNYALKNGTSYISQRAAEAIYTPEGKEQVRETIKYYMDNAKIMRETLTSLGLKVYGGVNAPYLWVKTPGNIDSWKFFEQMLYGAQVVCTPGVGFGPSGEGFVRLTAFGEREDCKEAMRRISLWMQK